MAKLVLFDARYVGFKGLHKLTTRTHNNLFLLVDFNVCVELENSSSDNQHRSREIEALQ